MRSMYEADLRIGGDPFTAWVQADEGDEGTAFERLEEFLRCKGVTDIDAVMVTVEMREYRIH